WQTKSRVHLWTVYGARATGYRCWSDSAPTTVFFRKSGVFTMSKKPVRVAVTGAAGQIGYALLFRIASGEMLGKDQPVILQLLEIPDETAQHALKGVIMELEDCAFPLLAGIEAHSEPLQAFKDTD